VKKAGARPVKKKAQVRKKPSRKVWVQTWKAPDFADSDAADRDQGEDLVVRRAAVDALGRYNGAIVVTDPETGRILSIVNQKLAFQSGFIPCSTIKVIAAMGALLEGRIDRTSQYGKLDLTTALAKSDNPYFAHLGQELGFAKVIHYARQFGLGERAGFGIPDEQPGKLPARIPPEGLGMMTSFGSGIRLTPLQLAAAIGAIANGGTLYWLQYPRAGEAAEEFAPRLKRDLLLGSVVSEIKPGLAGAVEFGTGRRAFYDAAEPVFGKTGTCTHEDNQTHMGWFGSFNEVAGRRLAVVVMLTGGRGVNGPVAAGIAGQVYRNLSAAGYYSRPRDPQPAVLTAARTAEAPQ
jgi:cell division protein FtsI/penicillin-binding protein 2